MESQKFNQISQASWVRKIKSNLKNSAEPVDGSEIPRPTTWEVENPCTKRNKLPTVDGSEMMITS